MNWIAWSFVTIVFAVALWSATRLAKVKLDPLPFAITVVASSLVAMIPVVGQFLCFCLAIYLVYHWSDAEMRHAVLAVILARGFAILLFLVVWVYFDKQREAQNQRDLQKLQQQMDEARTNSTN